MPRRADEEIQKRMVEVEAIRQTFDNFSGQYAPYVRMLAQKNMVAEIDAFVTDLKTRIEVETLTLIREGQNRPPFIYFRSLREGRVVIKVEGERPKNGETLGPEYRAATNRALAAAPSRVTDTCEKLKHAVSSGEFRDLTAKVEVVVYRWIKEDYDRRVAESGKSAMNIRNTAGT